MNGSLLEQPLPCPRELTQGHLGFLHSPSQTLKVLSNQALEEEQKYSCRGSPQTLHSAGPATESENKAWTI
jgi:hypothetical protein